MWVRVSLASDCAPVSCIHCDLDSSSWFVFTRCISLSLKPGCRRYMVGLVVEDDGIFIFIYDIKYIY